jgi:predicted O-methyltransferase YrrM
VAKARSNLSRYDLYELAAQAPEAEARFLRAVHGNNPIVLAEDFSGPCGIARAWLALDPHHTAICTDRDPEPLDHARRCAERDLGPDALRRIEFQNRDVLEAGGRADAIASLNFAMGELHTRAALLTYLRHALARLHPRGILVCDTYAGPDALVPGSYDQRIDTAHGVLHYTWRQVDADPLTHRVRNAMDFRLPDGSRMRDAFTYDWRLWSIPELRDACREAGFHRTQVYTALAHAHTESGDPIVVAACDDAPDPRADDDVELVAPPIEPDEPIVAYIVARA